MLMVLTIILVSALFVGAMTSPLWFDQFDAKHRRARRIKRGANILTDLRLLHDLEPETVILPKSCLRAIDHWIDGHDHYSSYTSSRGGTYRELAKLMHELANPQDIDNPVLLPSPIQARAELWLIRHRRQAAGRVPLHQRAVLRHHKALGR